MLDHFIFGNVSRISPEAPVPLVDVTDELFKLGAAANAVNNIRVLGGEVIVTGVVGNDWVGQRVIDLLKIDDIDTSGIICCTGRPTTIKSRVIVGEQQIIRFDREEREPIPAYYSNKILNFMKKNINSIDLVLISDYNKGTITRYLLEELIGIACMYNKPVLVYPKVELSCSYNGVTLVITTIENASRVTGITQINETSIRNMGQWLLTHLGCENIMLYRGNDGISLFHSQGEVTHIPALNKGSYPALGRIDTIASIIALALPLSISHIIDAVRLANVGGGLLSRNKEFGPMTLDDLINQIDATRD